MVLIRLGLYHKALIGPQKKVSRLCDDLHVARAIAVLKMDNSETGVIPLQMGNWCENF